MSASRETEITRRMAALRTQGTRVAAQLPRDLDRARDWREHVRAHPVPAVLAAAAAGFILVPGRKSARYSPPPVAVVSQSPAVSQPEQQPATRKAGVLGNPIAATVGAWVGRWALATATGALQRMASEHLNSLPTSFMKYGSAPSQRRGDTTEQQRRAYSQ
jgi:hypothetical protein